MATKKPIILNGGQVQEISASDQIPIANVPIDTDGTMAANSDSFVPTQKAVVTYVAANAGGGGLTRGQIIALPYAMP